MERVGTKASLDEMSNNILYRGSAPFSGYIVGLPLYILYYSLYTQCVELIKTCTAIGLVRVSPTSHRYDDTHPLEKMARYAELFCNPTL